MCKFTFCWQYKHFPHSGKESCSTLKKKQTNKIKHNENQTKMKTSLFFLCSTSPLPTSPSLCSFIPSIPLSLPFSVPLLSISLFPSLLLSYKALSLLKELPRGWTGEDPFQNQLVQKERLTDGFSSERSWGDSDGWRVASPALLCPHKEPERPPTLCRIGFTWSGSALWKGPWVTNV